MKEIKLTQGKVAFVDDADFEWLNQWKWSLLKTPNTSYAVRGHEGKAILMHRLILGLGTSKMLADHRDGNGLNNQRSNIRTATRCQNKCNAGSHRGSSSFFVGVSWHSSKKRWRSQIMFNKKSKHLGTFKDEKDAALAYNNAAIQMHGQFAKLNSFKTTYHEMDPH